MTVQWGAPTCEQVYNSVPMQLLTEIQNILREERGVGGDGVVGIQDGSFQGNVILV